ncbi:MAG: efflux RND transporter periplasmic adaptor subunit [Pseudomonadota bacterium]
MQYRNVMLVGFVLLLFLVPETFAQSKLAKIVEVRASDVGVERIFFGRVKARQTIDLAFQVAGQIVDLPIDEGQPIAEGELIGALDIEPFELGLARARAQFNQAQTDFERVSRLRGTVSQATIDDAETAVELNRIAVLDAERALRLATLEAPFEGIVARRSVPNFTTIAAGTPVVRLHDMSDIRIEIEVPELLFQQAGRDPDVELEVEFAASKTRYPVEFREVVAETAQVGQTFKITLGMEPRDEIFVLPGSSATVYARIRGEGPQLIIPAGSLVYDPDGTASVMIFEATAADAGTVRKQAVKVTPTSDGFVEVEDGLVAGDEIVAAGAALLNDGEAVIRFAGFVR